MTSIDQSQLVLFLGLAIILSSAHAIHHRKQNSETPVYSLPLYHRDSVLKPQDQNLTARTISMLAGDLARLKYMDSLLRNDSDAANFQAPVTATSTNAYVARIGVGTPVKEYYLEVDTGSDVTWLQCLPCKKCYQQSDPIFDPLKSSSYEVLNCLTGECNELLNHKCGNSSVCMYEMLYADGSSSEGEYAFETVTFGMSSGNLTTVNVTIGCGNNNQGTFKDYAGLLGLSWGSKSAFPTQIGATSFSYCLVDPVYSVNKSSTLDFNLLPEAATSYVPMRRNPVKKDCVYYYLRINGITVGQDRIPIPPSVYEISRFTGTGGIVIDSGCKLTYLDPVVYHPVREAFKKNAPDLKTFEKAYFPGLDNCYEFPDSYDFRVKLPTLSFEFVGGVTLALPRENYLVEVASSVIYESTTFCFSFQPYRMGSTVSVIGYIQQRRVRFTYDLSDSRIGITPNQC